MAAFLGFFYISKSDSFEKNSLLGRFFCSRWIRFFITSAFAIARLQCEDKIKDSHVCDCLCLGCLLI